jgi:hypothetical protein
MDWHNLLWLAGIYWFVCAAVICFFKALLP